VIKALQRPVPLSLAWRALVAAGLSAALVALALTTSKVRAQPTASLPDIILTTGITTGAVVQIAAVNPSRRSFQICATTAMNVAPINTGSLAPVVPTSTATGNGIPIAAGACLTPPLLTASGTSGGMGAAWNAIAQTATGNVSFLEY
jgi:hypothetical protein